MKTSNYTFTWRAYSFRKSNSLCRFTLNDVLPCQAIDFFVNELSHSGYESKPFSRPHSLRLVKCGRLVARQATYQGV